MTIRIGAAVAAGFLAIGVLVGAAGTIVLREASPSDYRADMAGMTSMMGEGGMGGMMSMMGSGGQMGPDASMGPEGHDRHHPSPSPGSTR